MPRIVCLICTHGHLDYAYRAVESFFEHSTVDDRVLLFDDATPNWNWGHPFAPLTEKYISRFAWAHFEQQGGVIRSWNHGFSLLRNMTDVDYVAIANSDVLFSPDWADELIWALDEKVIRGPDSRLDPLFRLVGPVTNCPGPPQYGGQQVKKFFPDYSVSDDPEQIAATARFLREGYCRSRIESHINGFFMMARNATWQEGRFDEQHVFNPRNTYNSRGEKCSDPLNCLGEDELQRRWLDRGWKVGIVPGSFVFHYRGISRGPKYAKVEGAYRPAAH